MMSCSNCGTRTIPIVRRQYLADGSLLSKVIGKETINVSVELKDDTRKMVYAVAGGITGAILIHAIIRKVK